MENRIKIILITLVLVNLVGCTIQKREHLDGWNVQWKKRHEKPVTQNEESEVNILSSSSKKVDDLTPDLNSKSNDVTTEDEGVTNTVTVLPVKKVAEEDTENESEQKNVKVDSGDEETTKSTVEKNKENESGDGLLYSLAALIGLGAIGGIHLSKRKVKRLNRWAKRNPKRTRWFIAGTQLLLSGIHLYGGYNLHQMGYSISDVPMYVAAGMLGGAMASMPFLLKREELILPKRLKRRRLAFITAVAASSVLMTGYGNKVQNTHPHSFVAQSLASIDQNIFPQEVGEIGSNGYVNLNTKFQKKSPDEKSSNKKSSGDRLAINILLGFLSVLAILALVVTLCAGICIAVLAGSALGVLGGVMLAALSVWGMVAIMMAWIRRATKD